MRLFQGNIIIIILRVDLDRAVWSGHTGGFYFGAQFYGSLAVGSKNRTMMENLVTIKLLGLTMAVTQRGRSTHFPTMPTL